MRSAVKKDPVHAKRFEFSPFPPASCKIAERKEPEKVGDVCVTVSAVLGHTTFPVREILKLEKGAIIRLENEAGSPAKILVNGKEVAQGEVQVFEEKYVVRITDLAGAKRV